MPHLPTTQSAVLALEELAARPGREVRAQHDIGRDRTFAGPVVTVPGEDGYREGIGAHDLTPWPAGRIR
ncbi:hypothetical protein [Streptomyces sp. NRRL WC-3742]|uniref:hypothetical protein n=1 Tax=Streptomyces sp. NRRL WC-3742 TaxID=1463934 RepID=UPI0004C6A29B|nr:hypothetical protein [Streptomyces sp. NRRL WC-3742]